MNGDQRIIDKLNAQLSLEYGAAVQYTVHSSIVANQGYSILAETMMARAKQEMGHADRLQDRITFLGGVPTVKLQGAGTGATIPEMLDLDLSGEQTARAGYNELVKLCIQLGDNGTRQVVEQILLEEEDHINYIDATISEIGDLKLPLFLSTQVGK